MDIFVLRGKDPQTWLEQAKGQRVVASLILERFWVITRSQLPGDAQRVERLACMRTYMMLLGFAFENLAKAVLITLNPNLVTEKKLQGWPDSRGGHGFRKMIKSILKETSPEEDDLLNRLEEYVVWAGRYPIPLKARDYKRAEQEVGFRFHGGDPDLAERIFERLVVLVGSYEPWKEGA